MKNIFFVAAGGAVGSVGRYLVQKLSLQYISFPFPIGTLVVNVAGCLLIGIFSGMKQKEILADEQALFLMTGICGGFTTFSAFSSESLVLLGESRYSAFFLYVVLSLVLGFTATFTGYILTK